METPINNITLSFPCRENWDRMEVVPGGRLCKSCVYIVRDFRDCSMSELQEASKNGQLVCGRFRKDQLSPGFLKAAVVVLSLTSVTGCETETPQVLPQSQWIDDEEIVVGELTGIVIEVRDSVQQEKSAVKERVSN